MGHGRWGEGPPAYDLPDVADGELFSEWIHLRVANIGQGWLTDVRLRVLANDYVASASSPMAQHLAPGQRSVLIAPLQTHRGNVTRITGAACPLAVMLRVEGAHGALLSGPEPVTLRLRCRGKGESFLFTFLDADGSPQAAGARAPTKECREAKVPHEGCAVLVSLHGMDVTAQRQADAYRSKRRLWVLAPHGRATHSFFWQGPAHWHALAALAALRRHAATWHEGRFRAGPQRILTGHSNGGYGALLLAALEPAYALAVAPLAGMPLLGDAGRDPAGALHTGEAALEAVLAAAAGEYRVDLLAANLRGVPFLARSGALDDVISPHLSRRAARLVCLAGGTGNRSECGVFEVAGKGHWWWDTAAQMDGGALDDPQMRRFWARAVSASAAWAASGTSEAEVVCLEAAACGVLAGLRAAQLLRPGRSGRLMVRADEAWTNLSTRNVRRIAAADLRMLARHLGSRRGPTRRLSVDGAELDASALLRLSDGGGAGEEAGFCLLSGGGGGNAARQWQTCAGADWSAESWRRAEAAQGESGCMAPGTCRGEGERRGAADGGCCALQAWERTGRLGAGPLRRVFSRPWACVYGTGGAGQERHTALEACQVTPPRQGDMQRRQGPGLGVRGEGCRHAVTDQGLGTWCRHGRT